MRVVASRRAVLKAGALSTFAALVGPRRSDATDYADAKEVFDTVDRLEAEVDARLGAIAARLPSGRPLVSSLEADHRRHRTVRARLRGRLHLSPASPAVAPATDAALDALRTAQEALVYAHAEGLPALGDAATVDAMAHNMIDLARHLAVIDLWMEMESSRA